MVCTRGERGLGLPKTCFGPDAPFGPVLYLIKGLKMRKDACTERTSSWQCLSRNMLCPWPGLGAFDLLPMLHDVADQLPFGA